MFLIIQRYILSHLHLELSFVFVSYLGFAFKSVVESTQLIKDMGTLMNQPFGSDIVIKGRVSISFYLFYPIPFID